jgi:hypothetical protein
MKNYESADFLSRLSTNNLPDPTEFSVVGLVKADAEKSSVINFSHSLACVRWLTIPIEIVETIDHLKTVACKDHQHPLVRIKFKRPDEVREDVAFFLTLLSQMQISLARTLKVVSKRNQSKNTRENCADDFCMIWEDSQGVSVCCFHCDELECTGIV